MRLKSVGPACALVAALVGTFARLPTAQADASSLEPFFGRYEGEVITDQSGEVSKRDMNVEIEPYRDGFTMRWTTLRRRADGTIKRKDTSLSFLPTKRRNVFASAMKRDLFGHEVPADPMQGDPYVWASLDDGTLTLHALLIKEDGSYEMQTYRRTLTASGLDLEFERVEEGGRKSTVSGRLTRVEGKTAASRSGERR